MARPYFTQIAQKPTKPHSLRGNALVPAFRDYPSCTALATFQTPFSRASGTHLFADNTETIPKVQSASRSDKGGLSSETPRA